MVVAFLPCLPSVRLSRVIILRTVSSCHILSFKPGIHENKNDYQGKVTLENRKMWGRLDENTSSKILKKLKLGLILETMIEVAGSDLHIRFEKSVVPNSLKNEAEATG